MRTKTLHLRGFTPFSLKRSVFVDDSEDGTLDFKDSASMFDSTDDEEIPTAKVGLGSPIKHSSFNRTKNPIKQISNAEEITLGHKAPSKSSSKSATSNTSSPIAFETAVPEIEHDLPLKDIHNHQKEFGQVSEAMMITSAEYQTLFNELKMANLSISRLKSANAELLKTCKQQKQNQLSLENEILVHHQKELQDRNLLFAENKLAFDQIAKLQFELQEISLNSKISTENRLLLDELEKLKAEKSQMEKDLSEKILSNTLEKQKIELEKDYAVRRASFFQKQVETQEAEFELFAEKIKNVNLEIRQQEKINQTLRKKLRQLQYHPTNDYNNEVDNAEVDALKVCMIHKMMVQDLSVENSELKTELEKTGIENKDLSILSNVSNSNPFSLSTDCVDQKYGNQWNRTKFSTPENHVKLQIPVTSVPPRLNFEVFSPITGVSRVYTQPKVLSRHNFDGTSNSPTPNSSTTKNLLETKESLEKLLGKLAEEQRALNFELARIPSTGHRARTRMEAVEDKLHIVEQQMASTRHKMKQLGIF